MLRRIGKAVVPYHYILNFFEEVDANTLTAGGYFHSGYLEESRRRFLHSRRKISVQYRTMTRQRGTQQFTLVCVVHKQFLHWRNLLVRP